MASRVISAIGFLWLLLAACGTLATLPLYAFYPGGIASGDPGYNPRAMHTFAIACGVAFFALLLYSFLKKSTKAAVTFLVLLTVSTIISVARVASVLRYLQ